MPREARTESARLITGARFLFVLFTNLLIMNKEDCKCVSTRTEKHAIPVNAAFKRWVSIINKSMKLFS